MQESVVIKNLDHLGLVAAMVDELEIETSVASGLALFASCHDDRYDKE